MTRPCIHLRDYAEVAVLGREAAEDDWRYVAERCSAADASLELDGFLDILACLLPGVRPAPKPSPEARAWIAEALGNLTHPSRRRAGYLRNLLAEVLCNLVLKHAARARHLQNLLSPAYLVRAYRAHLGRLRNMR